MSDPSAVPPVIRVDVQLPEAKAPAAKFNWLGLLNSTVLTALVTAFVGGFAAQCVVQEYQKQAKANEFALLARKEQIAAQRAAVELATTLLAEGYYHAQSMHGLTLRDLDPKRVPDEDRPKLIALRDRIVEERNSFHRQWHQRKQTVTLRLGYDFDASPQITHAWRRCTAALEAMLEIADEEFKRQRDNPGMFESNEEALRDPETKFNAAVDALTRAVEKVRAR